MEVLNREAKERMKAEAVKISEPKRQVFVDEIFDWDIDDDGNIDVRTVGEILFGDGSGDHPRGIMTAMVESGAFAEKFPPVRKNRAARRAERKKARGR